MEQPGNNDPSATATSGASVSTMPTATPIASEIISDFEPDSYEITPLEKVTFDCNDSLVMQDDTPSGLVLQPENGKQQEQPDEKKSLETTYEAQVSQDSGLQQSSSDEKSADEKNLTKPPKENGDPVAEENSNRNANGDQLIASSNDISSRINDCASVSDKHESDADHLTATISVEESIAASALVQVAEGQPLKAADIETTSNTKDSNGDQQRQYSAIETQQQHSDRVPTAEESEHASYLFSLSQTSVDAQMEKVIENIVELGEGHEFSHSLSQVEDREKLLESIQESIRDVPSVKSSIDLIADVASKQQFIEISPSESDKPSEGTSKQNVQAKPTHDNNIDLSVSASSATKNEDKTCSEGKAEKVQDEDVTAKESPVPSQTETADKPQNEEIVMETVEELAPDKIETVEEQEAQVEEPVAVESGDDSKSDEGEEVQVEPIIQEQDDAPEEVGPEGGQEAEKSESGDKKADADIVVEPLGSSDEAGEPMNLEPVVEEASSADESEKAIKEPVEPTESAAVASEKPVEEHVEKTQDSSTEPSQANAGADQHASPDVGRRKSSRKPKPTKEIIEERQNLEDSRRSSRRVSSRKRPAEEDAEAKDVASAKPPETREEEAEKIDNVVQESAPEQKADQKMSSKRRKKAEESEIMEFEESKVEKAASPVEKEEVAIPDPVSEKNERPSRSLRVRAPKRPIEEESPKVEPPKKQVKRSRGTPDFLNQSSEPQKSTSAVKVAPLKTRMTISTADPSTRPGAHKERAAMLEPSDKKYLCQQCDYATDRLNNLVYHKTKSYCKGKHEMAEIMKNDIIKQLQAKGKRRQVR